MKSRLAETTLFEATMEIGVILMSSIFRYASLLPNDSVIVKETKIITRSIKILTP